ncbi:MAG: hypothetical protein ACRDHF_00535 [Tepidiformaceae bacterium]
MKPRTAAQQALPLGTRVRLSEDGKTMTGGNPNRSGVVVGYGRDGETVLVLWDGQTQPWFCHLLVADPLDVIRLAHTTCFARQRDGFCGECAWLATLDAARAEVNAQLAEALEKLESALLHEHREVEIIQDYLPPYPRSDTRPIVAIRHKPCGNFLRYSRGPRTGTFWDVYGDDFLTRELALVEVAKAPPCPFWKSDYDARTALTAHRPEEGR